MNGETYVVKEVVSTIELLQRLDNHPQYDTVEHARSREEFMPLLFLQLGLTLLLDIVQLFNDAIVVLRNTIKLGKCATGVVDPAVPVIETG